MSWLGLSRLCEKVYVSLSDKWSSRKSFLLSDLGRLFERSKDTVKAMAYFEKAYIVDPDNAMYCFDRETLYEKKKDFESAVSSYEKTLVTGSASSLEFKSSLKTKIADLKSARNGSKAT